MVISKNAWVAIGPAEPTQKLYVSGNVLVDTTTSSYDKDTGGLVVQGGVGIEENLNVGGSITALGTLTGDVIRLRDRTFTPPVNTVIKVDKSQSSDSTITLPSGNVTLATTADLASAASAAGTAGQVQYHDGSTGLAATSDLTYDGTKLTIGDVTTSTSTQTGALVVRGV